MSFDSFIHSRYSSQSQVLMCNDEAMEYLYFNGHCPLDCTQADYARRVQFSTICQHLRAAHCFTFNHCPLYTKSILYSISDSKAIFNHLRNCKDDLSFANEWVRQQILPWSPNDKFDSAMNSDSTSNVRNTTDIELHQARNFLANLCITGHSVPIIYQIYKFMFDASETAAHYCHYAYLQTVILKICSMRLRMDKRVRYYEERAHGVL